MGIRTLLDGLRRAINANASVQHWADPPIRLTDGGFSTGPHHIAWEQIHEIRGYKIDLLTTDEVRFEFLTNSGVSVVVSEEQHGFAEFAAALKQPFPEIIGWEAKIIHPAFATNFTVLYRHGEKQGSESII